MGKFGAIQTGDRMFTPDCHERCGPCCPEFRKDVMIKPEDSFPQSGKVAAQASVRQGALWLKPIAPFRLDLTA